MLEVVTVRVLPALTLAWPAWSACPRLLRLRWPCPSLTTTTSSTSSTSFCTTSSSSTHWPSWTCMRPRVALLFVVLGCYELLGLSTDILDHGKAWGGARVAPSPAQGAYKSQNSSTTFCQWAAGFSLLGDSEGYCSSEASPLAECFGGPSRTTPGSRQYGPQEESGTGPVLQLLRPLWQERGFILLQLWVALCGGNLLDGTTAASVAVPISLELSGTSRKSDSPEAQVTEIPAQGRSPSRRAWERRQGWRQGQSKREAEWPTAAGTPDASIRSSTAPAVYTDFLRSNVQFVGSSDEVGSALVDLTVVEGGSLSRSGQHAGGSGVAAEPNAEQGPSSSSGHANESSNGAAQSTGGSEGLYHGMVGLHGEAPGGFVCSTDGAEQGSWRLHGARGEVETATEGVHRGSFTAVRGCAEGEFRRGLRPQYGHEDCEGRPQGSLGSGRDHSAAQGEPSRVTLSSRTCQGEGGSSSSGFAGKGAHPQAHSAGRRRTRSPCQGSGMSLMILSGPLGIGVQQWTHSVVRSPDFVFPCFGFASGGRGGTSRARLFDKYLMVRSKD